MGTRNLTAVFKDGEYKVAQYGQWDGYPSGQGSTILSFIKDKWNRNKLEEKLSIVRFATDEDFEEYNKNVSYDKDNRTPEQIAWNNNFLSRDIGGEILNNILVSEEEEILLQNSINFAADSLFCEWAYVVDYDANTFEIYEGFNKEEVTPDNRFYDIKPDKDNEYTQVKLVKKYSLDNLPSCNEFVFVLEPSEEEE